MRQFIVAMTLLLFLMAGCAGKSNYHELAVTHEIPTCITSELNGVLVGIEKYYPDDVDKQKGIDDSRYTLDSPQTRCPCVKRFKKAFSQKKVMIVSHILEYQDGKRTETDLYNPFMSSPPNLNYEQGYVQLDKLQEKIQRDLTNGDYTHLFFMSMGWHNNQFVSVENYNKIIYRLRQADSNRRIKPYSVVITWPSSWGSKSNFIMEKIGWITSYVNKPQDADEIGFTISNYLLHNVILAAVHGANDSDKEIKTIGIGHSLGARLITRAIFSSGFLKEDRSKGSYLDLFIGLQPAFSCNRFIKCGGMEGSPYDTHAALPTKFLITTSENDSANPVAFWSEHMGGKDSFDTIFKNPSDFNVYDTEIIDKTQLQLSKQAGEDTVPQHLTDFWQSPKKVEIANCKFVENHNDFDDDEMGLFLFQVINNSGI